MMSPVCTGPRASAGGPRLPSDTTTISEFSTPRKASTANRSARGKSARASVTFNCPMARSSSLVSPPTRFDAWIEGDPQALRPAEVAGFRLFIGKAGCVLCHVGWRFTDDRFHDIGLPSSDGGRSAVRK